MVCVTCLSNCQPPKAQKETSELILGGSYVRIQRVQIEEVFDFDMNYLLACTSPPKYPE